MWPPEYEVALYLRDILHKIKFCKITHSILQYEEDVILIAPIQASRRVAMKTSNILCKNRKEIFLETMCTPHWSRPMTSYPCLIHVESQVESIKSVHFHLIV
jgi:hypothetical protein